MKKLLIFTYSSFFLIILINVIFYKSLYNKQIKYISSLLQQQVQIVGLSVDNTNNLISDLNRIIFSDNLEVFFTDKDKQHIAKENMKLFFSTYQDFVTGIKLFDNNKNEFTLKKDEISGEWLDQQYVLHIQQEIFDKEKLIETNRKYEYYLPVIKSDVTTGNIVITVDYQRYFDLVFSMFNLKDYQWQWVVNDSGELVYNNSGKTIKFLNLHPVSSLLSRGSADNLHQKAIIDGKSAEVISSFYPTQLLERNLGIVFSSTTDIFQKYIIRNSFFIVLGTLILIQVIIFLFLSYLKSQKAETKRLADSEKTLFKLIEEMPAGIIIHNRNREIIKANKVAASQYSYSGEEDMKGKIFPETSHSDVSEYFSKNLGGTFNADQFVIIKKEVGEIVLFRNTIPVIFKGEEANMEILMDVTLLESARKQEAQANVAKSEFLARMSYEIRTPLNGIVGMTDILYKYDLSGEVTEIVNLLRRSTEVLLNIINDILDFSKIETGKMILDEIPFNIREEISYCADLAKTYIGDSDITFTTWIDNNVPESIIADPFRLRQILTNLISHSARNTDHGELRLSCRLIENVNGIIKLGFELLDTGTPFDKASLKKIFGDFVNMESKSLKASDESKFGTILARQLIEMMGGELIAESPSGISGNLGTKIIFSVSAYSNDRINKNIEQEKIRSFSKIKTLVITGSNNRDEELLGSLHKLGLNISVTTFQKSTLSQIKSNLSFPDDRYNMIIISDDDEFNGFEAAKMLWENNLSSRFLIIMISDNDLKGNYMRCVTMGVDHYLVKPYDAGDLAEAVVKGFPFIKIKAEHDELSDVKSDIRILIVEDNKMNQKVLGIMLRNLGYSYDVSEDGYEGYMQAKKTGYDLIFMDLVLPEMSGFDTARKILAEDKTAIIVAYTGDNIPATRKKAELSGIKEFLAKPVRAEDLKKLFAKYFKKG